MATIIDPLFHYIYFDATDRSVWNIKGKVEIQISFRYFALDISNSLDFILSIRITSNNYFS